MATIIRDNLVELLVGVNQCLAKTRQRGEIALYLDAALLLAIGGKMEIPHVDGIASPRRGMEDILHHVGRSQKYKSSWFNDDVGGRLSKNNELYHYRDLTNLSVWFASPGYILRMKLVHGTKNDLQDIKYLIRYIDIQNIQGVEYVVSKYYYVRYINGELYSAISQWFLL